MNTGNRVLWIAIGAVLTAAGVLGILANQGRLPGVESTDRLADGDLVSRWHSWGGLATGITIAAGLLVALLGFLLLRAQLRGRGGAALPDLTADNVVGRTHVGSGALSHALTADLQSDRQVRKAAIRLVGVERQPELLVRLAVTADADLQRLHEHVGAALARFETTSGLHPRLREVTVRIADLQSSRVH